MCQSTVAAGVTKLGAQPGRAAWLDSLLFACPNESKLLAGKMQELHIDVLGRCILRRAQVMGVALNGKDDIRMLQSALMIGVAGVLTLAKVPVDGSTSGTVHCQASHERGVLKQVFSLLRRLRPEVYIKEAGPPSRSAGMALSSLCRQTWRLKL